MYKPREIITETYVIVASFDNINEAENCANYVRSKFVRFLIYLTLSSIHITKVNFQFVPVQDFTRSWSDKDLYEKYGLTDDEIAYIEKVIRPMN